MDFLNFFGSLVVLVEALLGILFSSCVIFIYFSSTSDRTSFNLICLSRAINNIIVLFFNFLILEFPTLLLSQNFYSIKIETLIIIITVNVYLVNEFQTILIAVNRFIAMFVPLFYHKLFNNKITLAFLVALYLERGYSSVTKLWSLFENNCEVIWGLDRFSIMYYDDSCSVRFPTGFDSPWIVFLPLGFFAVTILLNLMTFAKILRFYLVGTHNADSESMDSIKNNIRLFFQTVLQDSLFFVDVLFTFKLSSMSTHRLWYFISTVFVWESIHMLDGLIMLMFSDRISVLKSKLGKKSSNRVSGRGNSEFRAVTISHSMPDIN
ncbi:hypothetical protein CRE_18912 [Caenorhabditis remanei]|uniref:G-protein coupled receptors family 1 profile domain-containing protein n=1 Tax=Caenorhabditis remanei TaxID=31234 RepID=E3LJW2_CAERE|nr:hypothetical protein CRE_18912 [Caenorhabditis remanei]